MFKSYSKLSKEAVALYREHKGINDSIANDEAYIRSAEEMKAFMAGVALGREISGENLDTLYEYNMDMDIANVRRNVEVLEEKAYKNQLDAEAYLAKNPKTYDLAIKDARKDGVDLRLKSKLL